MQTPVIKLVKYARAKMFTPLMNTPDFPSVFGGKDGNTLPLDKDGHNRHIEAIAFPHTKFELLEPLSKTVYRVKTLAYPYGKDLFTDVRFLEIADETTPERSISLPPLRDILDKMSSLVGTRYFWGGNCLGIPQMLEYYPPKQGAKGLHEKLLRDWTLQGLDCSGLLYYATNGFTPRNTSSLVSYGKPVLIKGKKTADWEVRGGDLIVWNGHVVVVKNKETVIESREGRGVVETSFSSRIEEILKERTPVDQWEGSDRPCFVLRRWHPEALT